MILSRNFFSIFLKLFPWDFSKRFILDFRRLWSDYPRPYPLKSLRSLETGPQRCLIEWCRQSSKNAYMIFCFRDFNCNFFQKHFQRFILEICWGFFWIFVRISFNNFFRHLREFDVFSEFHLGTSPSIQTLDFLKNFYILVGIPTFYFPKIDKLSRFIFPSFLYLLPSIHFGVHWTITLGFLLRILLGNRYFRNSSDFFLTIHPEFYQGILQRIALVFLCIPPGVSPWVTLAETGPLFKPCL